MKHYEKRRSVSSKLFVMMLALVLVFGCAVGGTIAWLTAETTPVVNTFTYGDIDITLAETVGPTFKIVPGVDIKKDPKVTVKANSEDCWLFVKVEKENWPIFTETDGKKKVSYDIADGWIQLKDEKDEAVEGVYYREAKAGDAYYVLKGNTTYPEGVVTVSSTLTKKELTTLKGTDGTIPQPKLTFTAYAIQKEGTGTVEQAWAKINSASTPTT